MTVYVGLGFTEDNLDPIINETFTRKVNYNQFGLSDYESDIKILHLAI
jgi:hypothetical protein